MNTMTVKELGKKLMVVGGCTLAGGVGLYSTASIVDSMFARSEHKKLMLDEELRALQEHNAAVVEAEKAAAAADLAIEAQVKVMDKKEFAKWKAEFDAKASEEAIARARELAAESSSKIAKAKLECSEKVMQMESVCSRKVDDATGKYLEMKRKYDALNELFEDRDKILEAKEALAKFNEQKASNEQDIKDLTNAISKLVNK